MNKGKYTLESLLQSNKYFDSRYRLIQEEVDKVNEHVQLIEQTRSKETPRAGDKVQYTTRYGDYCPNALVEYIGENEVNICGKPSFPFIWPDDEQKGITCSTSGGEWAYAPIKRLQYIGKALNWFCVWGHCGPCAGGTIHFEAEVSLWEYVEDNPVYGSFTTKDWQRMHINKITNQEWRNRHGGYLYLGDGIAFSTEQEFNEFVALYRGTLFKITSFRSSGESYMLWYYKHQDKVIPKEEWDKLDLPSDIKYFYGKEKRVKTSVDDINHIVTAYLSQEQYYQK